MGGPLPPYRDDADDDADARLFRIVMVVAGGTVCVVLVSFAAFFAMAAVHMFRTLFT